MRRTDAAIALAIAISLASASHGLAQEAAPAPPPASVAEITALLDQEKPDPDKWAKLAAAADAPIPANLTGAKRGEALYRHAEARRLIGRIGEAIADAQEAVKLAKGENYDRVTSRYEQFEQRRMREMGDNQHATPIMMAQVKSFQTHSRGRLFSIYTELARMAGVAGDIAQVEQLDRSLHGLLAESRSWSGPDVEPFRSQYQSSADDIDGYLLELRNRYAEAEAIYRRARQEIQGLLDHYAEAVASQGANLPREDIERTVDAYQLLEGRMKVEQGRAVEGEVDIREVLIRRLQRLGKYHEETGTAVYALAGAMIGEGRYEDAEKLVRAVLEILQTIGFRDDTARVVANLQRLAQILDALNRPKEAEALYDRIDSLVAGWEPSLREQAMLETTRIKQLISAGKAAEAVALATRKLARERARSGDNSQTTAVARGYLASALAKAGRVSEALAAFRPALPPLLESARQEDSNDSLRAGAIADRNRYILENYLGLLAANPTLADAATLDQTIGLADPMRSRSVQRALAQASARSAAKDPGLGSLARTEQDLSKQLNGAVAELADQLALPPDRRSDKTVKDLQTKIAKLHADHANAQRDLARRFPAYANLIDPPPIGAADLRAALRDNEALLSFYFGDDASFVWAMTKSGPVAFKALSITAGELAARVGKLREALEPEAQTVDQIPPFDLALAYGLYAAVLQPVADVWGPARNILVTTNGALGFLPLGLLPVKPTAQPASDATLFAEYRSVPWLAREHAVTMLPSVSALKALRTTGTVDNQRQKLIGFGDPYFNERQAADAAKPAPLKQPPARLASGTNDPAAAEPVALEQRGVLLQRRSAQLPGSLAVSLASLPRLPDTADELRAIAAALGVDPAKTLKLGKDANERVVKTTKLTGYRIVAFATHGLMADDIEGLEEPALALTAPKVAGIDGDGLLTMEEILALKLNADWVLLSACNTSAGAGEGAEAISGLGRAFFYAGARALLVTNWSVQSQSARDLIADIFRRQAADAKLARAEALRQATMNLLDGPGFVDETGKTAFSYAHPLFWAPYTVVGDGGN
jgi:CHAT domain-containing protein/tetratricopeptide (TPR) repeat protein